MKTYKNTKFTKRECSYTNVVAAVAEARPNRNYEECDKSILDGLDRLYSINDVIYYGYL